jgi:hypothetical protein
MANDNGSGNWLSTLFQGVAESGMNYVAQNAPAQSQARGGKKLGKSCTPCAVAAKREQMAKRWRR